MRHWLALILYAAAVGAGLGWLRALWLLGQTPTPEPEIGQVHFQWGESTPRGDRLRLAGVGLLVLAVVLAALALWASHPSAQS